MPADIQISLQRSENGSFHGANGVNRESARS
jgi:hypothetical protein